MIVRTMRGKMLDMGLLAQQNEGMRAVGNAQMNARGDYIDPKGRVLKPQEQIAADYHATNPKAVRSVSLKNIAAEVLADSVSAKEAIDANPHLATAQARKARKLSDGE